MPRSERLARYQSIVGDVERRIACAGEDGRRGREDSRRGQWGSRSRRRRIDRKTID